MRNVAGRAPRIALIGFGEAAQAFVSGWALEEPARIAAFDVKTDDVAQWADMERRYAAHGVSGRTDLGSALEAAELVFSLVTADRALDAAEAASKAASKTASKVLPRGALWLDCNSCAPDTKRRAAALIEAAGGRYTDVAVMSPVHPKGHLAPLLISGPHAEAAERALSLLGMRPRIVGGEVGVASSIKMIRSIMIKGMEALSAECFLAARRAGVEEPVLASLQASDPGTDWPSKGAYNLERMTAHGARRAAEMREVAKTVAALGLPDWMSTATAQWQDRVAGMGTDAATDGLVKRADKILTQL